MVLEIQFENLYSFKNRTCLNFQAGNIQTQKAKSLNENIEKCQDYSLLKSLVIFGANASGKSNIFKAIKAAINIIRDSNDYLASTKYEFEPFKFNNQTTPSLFYIKFLLEKTEFEYEFSWNKERILSESLYHYPNGRKALIFKRKASFDANNDEYSFRPIIRRPMDVAINTSAKSLFLSRGCQMGRDILTKVFLFFEENIIFFQEFSPKLIIPKLKDIKKDVLLNILRNADSDIIDFKVENEDLLTFHYEAPLVPFNFFNEESAGTIKLFLLALMLLENNQNSKLFIVDELESSLHPLLIKFLLDSIALSKNSQIVFSTHNLEYFNLNRFRRDQIYLVEKDQTGNSDLYSLFDFKGLDENINLKKAYLQGMFKAIPYIYNTQENILE